jgi:serine/threonine protein kinase
LLAVVSSEKKFSFIVSNMRKRFGNIVVQAVNECNAQLALECYNDAKNIPQTETCLELKVSGYKLNGPWNNNAYITIAYDMAHKVYLMKELRGNEATRIQTFLTEFEDRRHVNLTSFFVVEAKSKLFMFMPQYLGTLEGIPVDEVDVALGRKIFSQMSSVLSYLHAFKFAHMDVKPSNICLDSNGNFILIDLGSIAKFGSSTETTTVFVPSDLTISNSTNRYASCAKHDWWMLAMTIAEKAYRQPIGYGTFSMSTTELRALLISDLPEISALLL